MMEKYISRATAVIPGMMSRPRPCPSGPWSTASMRIPSTRAAPISRQPATSSTTSSPICSTPTTGAKAGSESTQVFRTLISPGYCVLIPSVRGCCLPAPSAAPITRWITGAAGALSSLTCPSCRSPPCWLKRVTWSLRQLDESHSNSVHLYKPGTTHRLLSRGRDRNTDPAGTNPPEGAMIYYSLPDGLGDDTPVELSVYAADDEGAIWTWSRKPADVNESASENGGSGAADTRVLAAEPGLNRHVWDLHYPGMERFDGLILWSDMKAGPRAVPGDYRAELRVGDEVQEVGFSVVQDPRSSASVDDMAAQFAFVLETRDLLSRTH